jgi:3-deoxy-D-manno-octulosonate 8-phosphate phosphatase (KDO 8-P phosphatase)
MESFLTKLKDINTFVFDVDGVLTDGTVFMTDDGKQSRSFSIKDGFALQWATRNGYHVCAISGSRSEAVRHRLNGLGIKDIFLASHNKANTLKKYLSDYDLKAENVLYMGDDLSDMSAMKLTALMTCPADAVEEIKAISAYISPFGGGKGCVRDVIEKVLKIQEKWMISRYE